MCRYLYCIILFEHTCERQCRPIPLRRFEYATWNLTFLTLIIFIVFLPSLWPFSVAWFRVLWFTHPRSVTSDTFIYNVWPFATPLLHYMYIIHRYTSKSQHRAYTGARWLRVRRTCVCVCCVYVWVYEYVLSGVYITSVSIQCWSLGIHMYIIIYEHTYICIIYNPYI